MRYRELTEARPWKTYHGQTRHCLIATPEDLGNGRCIVEEADAYFGQVTTGRTETHHGYFVRIVSQQGEEWIGEDRHRLIEALLCAFKAAQQSGWSVIAIGLSGQFKETGLSSNSGFGVHPAYPDRHVHMLEPPPRERDSG